jgi:type VI secretion system secreted protein Hcp
MASDVFAKIGAIKGESKDRKHPDEIEVLFWSWGVAQSGSISPGGGAGAGKATFDALGFTHQVDKASPLLMKACATGQHIPGATITARKAGKGQHEYLVIKLTDVIVSGVSSSRGEDGTHEDVTLQFAKVDVGYTPQKTDGSAGTTIHFAFDIKANKVL